MPQTTKAPDKPLVSILFELSRPSSILNDNHLHIPIVPRHTCACSLGALSKGALPLIARHSLASRAMYGTKFLVRSSNSVLHALVDSRLTVVIDMRAVLLPWTNTSHRWNCRRGHSEVVGLTKEDVGVYLRASYRKRLCA